MSAKRILVVDDAKILCVGLERILRQQGYTVECAPDGQSAVSRVLEQEFHMVLIDLIMPGLDGVEACRQIKRARPQTVVVLMTGRVDEELEQREQDFQEAGGYSRCLHKPFEAEEVLAIIRATIAA